MDRSIALFLVSNEAPSTPRNKIMTMPITNNSSGHERLPSSKKKHKKLQILFYLLRTNCTCCNDAVCFPSKTIAALALRTGREEAQRQQRTGSERTVYDHRAVPSFVRSTVAPETGTYTGLHLVSAMVSINQPFFIAGYIYIAKKLY
jgi:hypothetical protein